jgi:hypothetical protein
VVDRLGGPTLAAIAAGPGLTAGEAVTVLAPVIIAVHELERLGFAHVRLAMSDVMFDGSGRPRLIGTGGLRRLEAATDGPGARTALVREMYTALARLVGDVAVITRPPGALDPVRNLLAELVAVRPFRTHEEELERMLFAVAEPAPIVVGPGSAVLPAGGRRRRSADSFDAGSAQTRPDGFDRPMGRPTRPAALDAPVADANHVDGHQPPERGRGWLPRALSSFDALVDESVPGGDAEPHIAGRLDALRARIRRMLASRRPVLIVGGLAGGAALVLALTLLPPAPEAPAVGEAGAPIPATAAGAIPGSDADAGAEADAAAAASDRGGGVPAAEDDPLAATAELLRIREGCLAALDAACLGDVLQPGSGLESADRAAVNAAVANGEAVLHPELAFDAARIAGEMGGAWLIEVPYREPERPPASILVMRSEAGWRLREMFG